MPVTEANSYELAFHVLPTVAEGEVATIFQNLKDVITNAGGTLGVEEAPARFDLAYEIEQYLEGRNRKFASAYFGWVRFTAEPTAIEEIDEQVRSTKELLRYMIIKLTKVEEENPFFFHEAMAELKDETIEIDEEQPATESPTEEAPDAAAEPKGSDAESTTASDAAPADGEESTDKV